MQITRKQANKFLLELDSFVKKYHTFDENIRYEFVPVFMANKKNAKKSIRKWESILIENLSKLCNSYSECERVINSTVKNDSEKLRSVRKSWYVQKIAYWMEYKMVKDLSYEHIFYKMCLAWGRTFPWIERYQNQLLKYPDALAELYVPVDWDTYEDLVIY